MDGTGHQVTTGLCMKVRISGLGTYVPPHILTNADLERMVDTSDAWIRRRTGVAERHIAAVIRPLPTWQSTPFERCSRRSTSARTTSTS